MAITDNLLGYWKCDETSGTNLNDSIGTADGTLTNTTFGSGGKINYGLLSDALTAHGVGLGTSSQIDIRGGAFSFSAWFNCSSGHGGVIYVDTPTSGTLSGAWNYWSVYVDVSDGKVKFSVYSDPSGYNAGTYANQSSTSAYHDGAYHHVVCTISSAGVMHIYVDGSTVEAASSTLNNYKTMQTGKNKYIGQNWDGNNCFWGYIDEVGVWNKELTSGEVTALYNSGDGLQYPFDLSLVNSNFFNFF